MGWRARPSRRTASRSNPRPQPSEVERGALSRHGRLRRATASAGRASGWPRGCTRAPAPKPGFRSNGMARSAVATHCVAVEPTTPAFGGGARRAQPAWPAAPRDGERGMRERVAAGMQARACTEAGLSDEGDGALGGTRTHDPSLRRWSAARLAGNAGCAARRRALDARAGGRRDAGARLHRSRAFGRRGWRARRDSNPRPQPSEGCTLSN
jgi:hypothetical protein